MNLIYILVGTISLILGIIGIFIPLLPTTPFLLLTAALYFRGSPKLYNRLITHKHLGPYILNFREKKALPLRVKIISLALMWATMLYCVYILDALWSKTLILAIAIVVSVHILSFKTLK